MLMNKVGLLTSDWPCKQGEREEQQSDMFFCVEHDQLALLDGGEPPLGRKNPS